LINHEKGYGGLCARPKLPEELTFTSLSGKITPQSGQVTAGPWMDFSASFNRKNEISGISVLCHPGTRQFPIKS
jgi:hypothetical protein